MLDVLEISSRPHSNITKLRTHVEWRLNLKFDQSPKIFLHAVLWQANTRRPDLSSCR